MRRLMKEQELERHNQNLERMRLEKLQRLENKIKKVEDLQQLDKRAHSEIIDIKQKTAREKEKLKAEISKI